MNDPNARLTIDVSSYLEAKGAGKAKIVKLNGVLHFATTQFNPATGEPVPSIVAFSRDAITNALAEAEKQQKILKVLLADADAAKEKLTDK